MKKLNIIFLFICALVLASCQDEDLYTGQDDPTVDNIGYLSMSGVTIDLIEESEVFDDEQRQDAYASLTRSSSEDDLVITITHVASNLEVASYTYAEFKTLSTIELTPGKYTISVEPTEQNSQGGWQMPTYYGEQSVTIVKSQTTELQDIKCTLSNIKVTLELNSQLLDMFKYEEGNSSGENLQTTISLGSQEAVFELGETRAYYFTDQYTLNTLSVVLSGYYNTADGANSPTYEYTTWDATISNVRAGQWREISIYVDNAYDGNIELGMSVEGWAYNDEVEIDVTAMLLNALTEEIIPEYDFGESWPNSPTVTLSGDLTEITISDENYDEDLDKWNLSIGGTVTPISGSAVDKIEIMFQNASSSLAAKLSEYGFDDNTFEIYPNNSLPSYFFIKESGSNVEVKIYDAGLEAMSQYIGEHELMIIATDDQERISYTEYPLTVISTIGPEVVWLDAEDGTVYSFDTRYDVSNEDGYNNPTVEIDITSTTGITSLLVNINSEVLTESTLTSMGLATSMDLVNPVMVDSDGDGELDDDMNEMLLELGFPTRDQVEGVTNILIDITEFMPALATLGNGQTDFELVATDSTGSTSRTILVTGIKAEN